MFNFHLVNSTGNQHIRLVLEMGRLIDSETSEALALRNLHDDHEGPVDDLNNAEDAHACEEPYCNLYHLEQE